MDPPSALVTQFCGVTNADEDLARQLLRDSGLDLEAAIASFFAIQEAGGLPQSNDATNDSDPSMSNNPQQSVADPVLPEPIPQMVDRLLPENAYTQPAPAGPAHPEPFSDNDQLAELFRPPSHLNFSGHFDDAMTAGITQKRWVVVNIQSRTEFACHALNRDVWSDPAVEQLLQAQFVFWQRDEKSQHAMHYKRFYPYDVLPHVALVDPRNGERVRVWSGDGITRVDFLTELQDFVTRNSLDDDTAVRGRTQQAASTRKTTGERASSANANGTTEANMTEDELLAAAIAASMEGRDADMEATREARLETNGLANGDHERAASRLLSATNPDLNRNRSLRAQQDNDYEESLAMDRAMEQSRRDEEDRKEKAEQAEKQRVAEVKEAREQKRRRVPTPPPEQMTEGVRELMIRLPDGKRLQRRFYANNTVGHVYDYIDSEIESLADGGYELMQAYPKLSFVQRDASLETMPRKAALVVGLKG